MAVGSPPVEDQVKKILVTGGAGYVGSCMVGRLLQEKYEVIVLDNLSMGHASLVDKRAIFVKGDLRRHADIEKVFKKYKIDAVMHFAASAYVGESVENPMKYYQNNVSAAVNLLNAMRAAKVTQLIFSSTCAVYGEPVKIPMAETHPKNPANPYGRTKLAIEWMLKDLAESLPAGKRHAGFSYISLRYFNACGAHSSGKIGEIHDPETHLVPNILKAAAGKKKKLVIFGDDFDTPDGSCVRDYIHVEDIAEAHLLALKALARRVRNEAFNLGTGKGFSNFEILKKTGEITGKKINYTIGPRRPGDPSRLIADASKAKKILGWAPKRGLGQIIRSAWEWEKKISK